MSAEEAAPAPRAKAAMFSRFLVAHVLSFPLALGWACAAIPPIIHLYSAELEVMTDMDAVGQFLVRKMGWPAVVGGVLQHLVVVPWLLAREPSRGRRFFVVATVALYGLCVVIGAAGWIWLHVRG